jgi:hypothetical protein
MLVSVTKPIGRFFQQPWEVKRYRIDYTKELAEDEIISLLAFVVDNVTTPPLAVTNGAIAPDGDQVTFFVGGGLTGNTYKVSARVTTNAGQQFEHELEFVIQER